MATLNDYLEKLSEKEFEANEYKIAIEILENTPIKKPLEVLKAKLEKLNAEIDKLKNTTIDSVEIIL